MNNKKKSLGAVGAALARWWASPQRKKQGERFGLGVALALALMSALALYRGLEARMEVLAMISATLLAIALVLPDLLFPPAWLLEEAVKLVTKAMLYLALIIVFFLVFSPAGIVLRLLGKDPLERNIIPTASSYWSERKPRDPSRAERQF